MKSRRIFLKQSLLFGTGWFFGARAAAAFIPSSLPTFKFKQDDFVSPLLASLHHERLALLGIDYSGAHTAAHMINDYLYLNGTPSRIFGNLQPQYRQHHNSVFLEKIAPNLETQRPGEKIVISVRTRHRGQSELYDFLLKNQFKVFIFETPSYSNAVMNSLIFKNLRLGSITNNGFSPEAIPVVKGDPLHLQEFKNESDSLQMAKSLFPNSTILSFNEAIYQNFVRTRLKSYPTWREPYLINPEIKLLNPEIIPLHPLNAKRISFSS